MASERLECFQYLHRNIATWSSMLEQISTGTAHRRIALDDATESMIGPQPALNPAVSLNKAVLSTTQEDTASPVPNSVTQPTSSPQSPHRPHNYHPPLPASPTTPMSPAGKRKRTTSSTGSGRQSCPSKSRSRNTAVIYYDSEAQSILENIVKNITTARSLIRKAKLAAEKQKMQVIVRKNEHDDDEDNSGSDSEDAVILSNIQLRRRLANSPPQPPTVSENAEDPRNQVFEKVDKALLEGMDSCEDAAFQLLREGDCELEIQIANAKFDEVLPLTEAEVSRLEVHSPPIRKAPGQRPLSAGKDDHNCAVQLRLSSDDDDDDDEISLPPIRMTTRMTSH